MAAGVGAWRVPPYYWKGMTYPSDPYQRQRIRWAVMGIQSELIRLGFLERPAQPLDGGFGEKTHLAVRGFQGMHGLVVDGKFGQKSSVKMWAPFFIWWQTYYRIPDNIVMGMCRLESALDPGAEGTVDDRDRGIGQFNRTYWPSVSDQTAFANPTFCIHQTAINTYAAYGDLGNWDCAIAHHNNPAKAKAWAKTGSAPDEQIREYVRLVRNAAALPF